MSEVTNAAPSALSGITVEQVIAPQSLGNGVLQQALGKKLERAREKMSEYAQKLLDVAQARNTSLATREIQLKEELAKIEKERAKIKGAADYADVSGNMFPLAAVVGAKQTAIQFAQECGLVVPPNDSSVWSVPTE